MRVLIPIDNSDHSNRVVDYVALHWLPADPALGVVLCYTESALARLGPTSSDDFMETESVCGLRSRADAALHYGRTVFASVGLEPLECAPRTPTVAGVLNLAQESGAHVIVLGTHGSDPHSLKATGALVEQMLAHSNVPVLIVP